MSKYKVVPISPSRNIEDAIGRARNLSASEIWEDALAAVSETGMVAITTAEYVSGQAMTANKQLRELAEGASHSTNFLSKENEMKIANIRAEEMDTFSDVGVGEAFVYNGEFFIKTSITEQAINLNDGVVKHFDSMVGVKILPNATFYPGE